MFNSSNPIRFYRGRNSQKQFQLWVCQWRANFPAIERDKFFLEAGHILEAKQIAKKIVRDEILCSKEFTFKVRQPTVMEEKLRLTPGGVEEIYATKISCAPSPDNDNNFAETFSADSTNKT